MAVDQGAHVGGIFKDYNTRPPACIDVLPLFSLKGRTAIVTGAAAGIGFATAAAFAEAGANVALWYNSNDGAIQRAEQLTKKYNVICKAYKVNVTSENAVDTAIQESIRDLNGRLDIFVANAGIPWLGGSIIGTQSADFSAIMQINFGSLYTCSRAAGQHFQRQRLEGTSITGEELKNYSGGSFIATSSVMSLVQALPQAQTSYNATKAAVTHFCKGLAVEWVKFARVNVVSPGYVSTEMLDNAPDDLRAVWRTRTPMGREGAVSEMKGAYLYLASDASSFATGCDLVVDGGLGLV